jgi:hypothetical protein
MIFGNGKCSLSKTHYSKKNIIFSKVAAATLEAKLPKATSEATLELYIVFNYKSQNSMQKLPRQLCLRSCRGNFWDSNSARNNLVIFPGENTIRQIHLHSNFHFSN